MMSCHLFFNIHYTLHFTLTYTKRAEGKKRKQNNKGVEVKETQRGYDRLISMKLKLHGNGKLCATFRLAISSCRSIKLVVNVKYSQIMISIYIKLYEAHAH